MVVKLHSGAVIQWGCCDLTAPLSSQVISAIAFHSSCCPAGCYFIWLCLFSRGWQYIETSQAQTCQNQFSFSISQFIVIFFIKTHLQRSWAIKDRSCGQSSGQWAGSSSSPVSHAFCGLGELVWYFPFRLHACKIKLIVRICPQGATRVSFLILVKYVED